jgi:hypothetical protein
MATLALLFYWTLATLMIGALLYLLYRGARTAARGHCDRGPHGR